MTVFYKSRLTIEIEIKNRFGPESAADLIRSLLNSPSVMSVAIIDCESDYTKPYALPVKELQPYAIGRFR